MAKKDLLIKYKELEKRYSELEHKYNALETKYIDSKQKTEKYESFKSVRVAFRLSNSISKLNFIKNKNNENVNNCSNVESNNISAHKIKHSFKSAFDKCKYTLKKLLFKIKQLGEKLDIKIKEKSFSPELKIKIVKSKSEENLESEIDYKNEISIIMVINSKNFELKDSIDSFLNQPYINFKIVLLDVQNTDFKFNDYVSLDNRISYFKLSESDLEQGICKYIKKCIISKYLLITGVSKNLKYDITKYIKLLDKGYIITLNNEEKSEYNGTYIYACKRSNIHEISNSLEEKLIF